MDHQLVIITLSYYKHNLKESDQYHTRDARLSTVVIGCYRF